MVQRRRWVKGRGGAAACALLAGLAPAAAVGCSLLDIGPLDVGSPDAAGDVGTTGSPGEEVGPRGDGGGDRSDVALEGGSPAPDVADARAGEAGSVSSDGPAGDGTDETAPDADSASDGPATTTDAGDAACGPAAGGATGQVLFDFTTTGGTVGWQENTNSGGPSTTIGWTGSEGHACAGALTLTIAFHAYDGTPGSAVDTPSTGSSWTATQRLHAWVKLAPLADAGPLDYGALGNLEVSVTSNNSANYSFIGQAVNPAFSDGAWHEMVLEFKAASGGQPGRLGPDVIPSSVQRLGVLLSSSTSRPAGSAPLPPAVVLFLDDVWVE